MRCNLKIIIVKMPLYLLQLILLNLNQIFLKLRQINMGETFGKRSNRTLGLPNQKEK